MKRREFLVNAGLGACALALPGSAVTAGQKFPALAEVGGKFRFVIVADPQVGHADDKNRVAANARRTLALSTQEINALDPQPAFVVYLGDLVNKFDAESAANFEECIQELKAPRVIVHGNHDTQAPCTDFRALMLRQCGFDDVFYSFDAGPWHFVVLPCNLNGANGPQREVEAAMLAWLEADLAANAQRPTVVFEHLHTLPIGLAQTEWYCFPLALRRKLMELYTRHGNVRWYFHGHVHCGFEASVKTSWNYRGINFVNCPTIIEMRPFGEEVAPFERGIDAAGYYVVAEVDGTDLLLTGRRAGQADVFTYPATFRPFDDALEPRWWRPLREWAPTDALRNGGFAGGLDGWHTVYRYPGAKEPGCEYRSLPEGVQLITRAKVSHFWANDEYTEAYQYVRPPAAMPVLEARYRVDHAPVSGGGYVRLLGMANGDVACHFIWHWGEHQEKADFFPRCLDYMIDGEKAQWNFLNQLGEQRRGLYWQLPHAPGAYSLRADLGQLFQAATGADLAGLGVSGWLIAVGTWCNKGEGSTSAAIFQGISFEPRVEGGATSGYTAGGEQHLLSTGPEVFTIGFAGDLIARQSRPKKKKA